MKSKQKVWPLPNGLSSPANISAKKKHEYVLYKQLLRSGTSIGANIAEAQYGSSRRDFLNKLYIALKECAETKYWLELLLECGYLSQAEHQSLLSDCEELLKILSSITKSTKENIERTGDRNREYS